MYYTVIKYSGHLRTLEECREHMPAAHDFYTTLVFSNASCVLSLTVLYTAEASSLVK